MTAAWLRRWALMAFPSRPQPDGRPSSPWWSSWKPPCRGNDLPKRVSRGIVGRGMTRTGITRSRQGDDTHLGEGRAPPRPSPGARTRWRRPGCPRRRGCCRRSRRRASAGRARPPSAGSPPACATRSKSACGGSWPSRLPARKIAALVRLRYWGRALTRSAAPIAPPRSPSWATTTSGARSGRKRCGRMAPAMRSA